MTGDVLQCSFIRLVFEVDERIDNGAARQFVIMGSCVKQGARESLPILCYDIVHILGQPV